jgi:hypothetical protein
MQPRSRNSFGRSVAASHHMDQSCHTGTCRLHAALQVRSLAIVPRCFLAASFGSLVDRAHLSCATPAHLDRISLAKIPGIVHRIDSPARLTALRADPMHALRYVDVVVLQNHVSLQMAGWASAQPLRPPPLFFGRTAMSITTCTNGT